MSIELTPAARLIWDLKYRFDGDPAERTIEDTWQRVARAVAAAEAKPDYWTTRFRALLDGFRFLPGGRILAGAGTGREVTLFNCFVMGPIEDSLDGIFSALREGALTMQQGGGVGYDFSTLRPHGTPARRRGTLASGPVSFMHVWDAMCATLLSTGARRGAMMATLRCEHPDIGDFVAAKADPAALRNFNLSVLVSDAFLRALDDDRDWALRFPPSDPGAPVLRTLPARALWEQIMRAAYQHAEPGVLFVDRINAWNNLGYCEQLSATNPCGEIPLPAYGACDLGSLNLAHFVLRPFSAQATLDLRALEQAAALAVRFLDDVIDVSGFALPAQAAAARRSRRIGLGVTGLADALLALGIVYGGPESLDMTARIMRCICHAAYRASVRLARARGAFPEYRRADYLERPFIRALPEPIRGAIARHGIRNSHLLAIAPAGSISLLAGNVSSGLEPVYSARQRRRLRGAGGESRELELTDHAVALYQRAFGGGSLPGALVTAHEVDPEAQLQIQAAAQPYVDNAISKTINLPAHYPFERFAALYRRAYDLGLKGCTTFRADPATPSVVEDAGARAACGTCDAGE